MKTIWVLCAFTTRCSGHGESEFTYELASHTWGTKLYPAFKSEQEALAFCDDRGLHHLTPKELEVQS